MADSGPQTADRPMPSIDSAPTLRSPLLAARSSLPPPPFAKFPTLRYNAVRHKCDTEACQQVFWISIRRHFHERTKDPHGRS